MEILRPEILRMATDVSVVLAALCVLVLTAIVAVRLAAQTRAIRAEQFRREAEPVITAYLAGREKVAAVAAILQEDPSQGLALLMEISDRLPADERAPLRPLFSSLPVRQKEAAAMQSRRWERRLQAAERLGYLGDGASTNALLDGLGDPVIAVRFAAARALAALGETKTIRSIVLAFDLPGEMNQRRVAEVLFAFGPAGVPALLEILENGDGTYSDNAVDVCARVLGMLHAPEAVEPLLPLLGHSDYRVRLNAVRSLGLIGDHGTGDAIARLAGDPAWEVRNVVMQSLDKIHSTRHAGILRDALKDASWWVRFSAAQALWSTGTEGRRILAESVTGNSDRYAREMSRQILEEHGAAAPREAHT